MHLKKQTQKSLQMFMLVMQQRKRNSGKSSEAEELLLDHIKKI